MKKQSTPSNNKRLQIESIEGDILYDIVGGPVDGEALRNDGSSGSSGSGGDQSGGG